MPEKKIVFLSTALAFGGAETQLVRLAILLKKRGWEVVVISMRSIEAYADELTAQGISVHSLNMRKGQADVGALFRLIKILKKERPAILHSYMVHANFLGRIARIFVPIPVVISSARNVHEGGRQRDWWYKLTDRLCDMTTQVSQAGLQRYLKEKIADPKRLMFVPNGIDVAAFRKDAAVRDKARKSLGVDGNFVWLAVGRFESLKDYPNMIKAFAGIYRNAPQSALLIVGQGSLEEETKRLVGASGLKHAVKFLGIRTDIFELMNAADAYVLSSAWEGMPNVLLEAASCELPIVATDVGGVSELMSDGVTGFLVPSKDPALLEKAMSRMMSLSSEARMKLGSAARKRIQETYSFEHIVTLWENLYNKLLAKKSSS